VFALREAGEAARGATLYVTLEPCCHFGRTPPCTEAVLAAGVTRVVAAMVDPFPKVSGGGLTRLREAGLQVESGLLAAESAELNRAYVKAVSTGFPWLTLKMAMTLDGKIATRSGDSRWVTGEAARKHVHRLRDWNDAVMVGIGTARADDPQLTARLRGARNPLRVIIDHRGELSMDSFLARTASEIPTLLVAGETADTAALEAAGAQVLRVPTVAGRVDLAATLSGLAARGVHSVLCEGGPALGGALLDAGLVDEALWFIAPKLLGGADAFPALGGRGAARMSDSTLLDQVKVRRFGADIAVSGYVHRDY
jgi:diaminohydroxyphosphoribosylaminopyrimidine deaminase/5-amino-6-(5-phosphoribosylamino)uracil reductase